MNMTELTNRFVRKTMPTATGLAVRGNDVVIFHADGQEETFSGDAMDALIEAWLRECAKDRP